MAKDVDLGLHQEPHGVPRCNHSGCNQTAQCFYLQGRRAAQSREVVARTEQVRERLSRHLPNDNPRAHRAR